MDQSSRKKSSRKLHKGNAEDAMYNCNKCSKSFPSLNALFGHVHAHPRSSLESTEIFKCSLCKSRKFKRRKLYELHMKSHEGKKGIKCEICNMVFFQKFILNRHMKNHENGLTKPFQCSLCKIRFSNKSNLNCHVLRVHSDPNVKKNFLCIFCGKAFFSKKDEEKHYLCHIEEKAHFCHICPKSFTQTGGLTVHLLSHTGESHYKCKYCVSSFRSNASLQSHQDKVHFHSERGKVNCEICDKKMSCKSALKRHMQIHRNEKPYQCEMCSKFFRQKGDLSVHIVRRHSSGVDRDFFSCSFCDKTFLRAAELRLHTMTHTKEKSYKCEICKKTCTRLADLRKHMMTHSKEKPYKCSICDGRFANKDYIKHHMETHHLEKSYKCNVGGCKKQFKTFLSLRSHKIRIHCLKNNHRLNPEECVLCGKRFSLKEKLFRHIRRHVREKP